MDDRTSKVVHQAYALFKAGNRQGASSLLIQLVKENPNVAEAWYVLGLAVDEPEKKTYAFKQVLRIDPSNRQAQEQLDRLQQSAVPAPAMERPASAPPSAARGVKPVENKKRRLSAGWILAGVAIVFLCVAGIGVWLVMGNGLPAAAVPLPPGASQVSPTDTVAPTAAPSPAVTLAPTPGFKPVFHSRGCPFDMPLGTRVRCGVVSVPQNRDKNLTDLIELPVVVYESQKPSAQPIIYLQGGPGEESINWSLSLFDEYVRPFLAEYDMVFFDPRGTGRSEPRLECPELNTVYLDAYFQKGSEAEEFKKFTDAWNACHDRFVTAGIDPAAFTTTQSAADVRDIALALGYDKVNLLGISYGTRLALTVMRDHPEIVRSTVIDSVVPMQARMINRRAGDVQYALDKVFSDCAASPACASAYPNLASVFNSLIERFDKKPVSIKIQDPKGGFTYDVDVNGVDMLSAIVWGLHTSDLVPVVPKAIYDIQNGDYTFLSFALGVPGGTYDSLSLGTYFAELCHEQIYATTPGEMDADLAGPTAVRGFALNEIFGSAERIFQLCQSWGAAPHDPLDSQPVNSDIPTLIISGQYDSTTPSTEGQMVADDLTNDHFYIIPGMGHGATVGNPCSSIIVMEFLQDPSQTPDSSCLDSLKAFNFFLPYTGDPPIAFEPLTDTQMWLKGVIPAGWKRKLPFSNYYRRAYLFDPTMIEYDSVLGPKDALYSFLVTGFMNSGFDKKPAFLAHRRANGLSWDIYESRFNGQPVLLALAEVNGQRTMAALMVVSAPERDAYYNALFLPMLDNLVVIQ